MNVKLKIYLSLLKSNLNGETLKKTEHLNHLALPKIKDTIYGVFRAMTNSPDAPLDKVLQYYKERDCKGVGEVMPKLLRKYKNLHLDLSDETAYNALTRDKEYGPAFLEEFQDRAYFGTDFCNTDFPDVPLAKTLIEWKNDGRISKEAFEKIERENAIRLLNL